MRYFLDIDVFQSGVSVGYFPNAIRKDVKSTIRISLYNDGLTAFDSLADPFLHGNNELHSGWLCYELQRQVQLSEAILRGSIATESNLELDFEHMAAFRLVVITEERWKQLASYTGTHQPIKRKVPLASVHRYDGHQRNIVMPVVRDIMEEVGHIFGLSRVPPNLWDEAGYLLYVRGLENQR